MAQAHVVKEDEGGLLLAEAVKIRKFPTLDAAAERVLVTAPTRQGVVHLFEERVFVQIAVEKEDVDSLKWVIDTGPPIT
jgi:hypothetical protein